MIYKPAKGSMWDPSVFWHDGRYYAIMMHNPDDVRGLSGIDASCGFIAHSEDGVHWQDGWEAVREPSSPHGGKFFKAFIGRIGWWSRDHGFTTADVIGRGCALVAGLDVETSHSFRLLVRHELFELYINDLLVQTYFLNEHWDGKFGFLAVDSKAEFANLEACRMTFD